MKSVLVFLLFNVVHSLAFSQVVAVQTDLGRKVMLCIDNHLVIAAEGTMCKNLLVETDNGTIAIDSVRGNEHYRYHAIAPGSSKIFVKRRTPLNKVEILDTLSLLVQRLPIGSPRFAGKTSGTLKHARVLAEVGLSGAPIENFDITASLPIQSFTIMVLRSRMEIFKRNNTGSRFDSLTQDFLYALKDNDQLKFVDITVKDCDGAIRHCSPLEFTIVETTAYENQKATDVIVEDPITGERKTLRSAIIKVKKK
jgi:hypothetical protein